MGSSVFIRMILLSVVQFGGRHCIYILKWPFAINFFMKLRPAFHIHHVTRISSQNLDETSVDEVDGRVEFDPGDGGPNLTPSVHVEEEDVA